MRALTWHDEEDVRVDDVPDPEIEEPTDAIIDVTATAICGSDLHLYDGYMPSMQEGDVLGHEPMGEVIEVGSEVETLQEGDRVVVTRADGSTGEPDPRRAVRRMLIEHERAVLTGGPSPWA